MRNKGLILTVLFIIIGTIFCLTYGSQVKASFVDDTSLDSYLSNDNLTVSYYAYPYDDYRDVFSALSNYSTLKDVENSSTIIVKAKLNENYSRKIYYECTMAQIDVEEVYSGDVSVGDSLYMFELANCYFNDTLLCTDGYNLMQPGEEYILFLNKLQNSLYCDDDYVYIPSTTIYSKFSCAASDVTLFTEKELENADNLNLYKDIRNQEVFLYDEEEYNKFVSIKREVLEKYIK